MPIKDPEKRREYLRQWMAGRRAAWFEGKSCARCGSTENLELDHIDRSTKVDSHIWSWSEERRSAELAKCQALCRSCHLDKTRTEGPFAFGEAVTISKLTEAKVREILRSTLSHRELGRRYGVSEKVIRLVRKRETWKHVSLD